METSVAYLKDFEWDVSLALSSDKLATLRDSLVNLNLDMRTGDKVHGTGVEMDAEEIDILITALEAANEGLKNKR